MKWFIASPILTSQNQEPYLYLNDLVKSDRHEVSIYWRQIPFEDYTKRKAKYTSLSEWLNCLKQALSLLYGKNDGIITLLVQLPTVIGLLKCLPLIRKKPVVALDFTIAHCRGGIYQRLARFALAKIERFGVFCECERQLYSRYLDIPIERFSVLRQYAEESGLEWQKHENEKPFVISLGSALRDYPTLIEATQLLNIHTVIASSRNALSDINIPSHVSTPFDITRDDCWKLITRSRIDVVPLQIQQNVSSAGFRAIAEALEIGCPLIATRGAGAEDYIIHGETGLLVEPNSVESMMDAIQTLWSDRALRERMSKAARKYAREYLSLDVRGQEIEKILDEVSNSEHGKVGLIRKI